MPKTKNRLSAETVSITIGATEDFTGHQIAVSMASDPETGNLREIIFVSRGKIGQGMDAMLHELGIKLSRAIQSRNPETGAEE